MKFHGQELKVTTDGGNFITITLSVGDIQWSVIRYLPGIAHVVNYKSGTITEPEKVLHPSQQQSIVVELEKLLIYSLGEGFNQAKNEFAKAKSQKALAKNLLRVKI